MSSSSSRRNAFLRNSRASVFLLNVSLIVLALIVGFLGYTAIMRFFVRPPVAAERAEDPRGKPIVISVLNGCGSAGMASRFTGYLRARGYDVVEMENYRNFEMPASIVVDRLGQRVNAERVAYALGIGKMNVIQQINRDEYVDVTVVIGKDHNSLKPSQ